MTITCVYLLTRFDGLKYVGITTDFNRRLKQHSKSKRFEGGIHSSEILAVCDSYSDAQQLEEHFIRMYDTFASGLNMTETGKGKNGDIRFNTYGVRHHTTTKAKMKDNHWSKRGHKSWHAGKRGVFSEDTKKRWSSIRSGKCWGKRTIDPETARHMIECFNNDSIVFDVDFLRMHVKKTQASCVHELELGELVSPNGRPLTRMALYCYFFSEKYGVTTSAIRSILTGKTVLAVKHDE